MTPRAAHCNHTSLDGWIHSTVTVPMLFKLNSIIKMDSGGDSQHPSNPVTKQPSMALDIIEREYPNELYLFIKPPKLNLVAARAPTKTIEGYL